jgi:hypothetical protein
LAYLPDHNSGNSNLSNTTAIGANATVGANNSLVLGSIAGLNGATADTLVGIGTPTPTAKLDVRGTANFTGLITFAAGQTFPGAGTITGVTAGTGLTGGGTSGNVPLSLDTTKVPQLSTANTFTGNQTVNANLSATGVVSAASYQIGSNLFAAGNATTNNVYLGFAGNQTTTGYGNTGTGGQALVANAAGVNNTATGQAALPRNTSGTDNVAMGVVALEYNTQGNYNTASGVAALAFNTTGSNNTAVGYLAGPDANHPNLVNATAIGANAVVSESNALVLGPAGVSVGIGTATPAYPLHVNGVMRSELGLSLGGNAPVVVDAPGIVAGRFTILANGNVGINKPNPTNYPRRGRKYRRIRRPHWRQPQRGWQRHYQRRTHNQCRNHYRCWRKRGGTSEYVGRSDHKRRQIHERCSPHVLWRILSGQCSAGPGRWIRCSKQRHSDHSSDARRRISGIQHQRRVFTDRHNWRYQHQRRPFEFSTGIPTRYRPKLRSFVQKRFRADFRSGSRRYAAGVRCLGRSRMWTESRSQ